MSSIFISYSSFDRPFAKRLYAWLQEHGHQPILDVYDFPEDVNWYEFAKQKMIESDLMIGILSPDSISLKRVTSEWDYAYNNGRGPLLLLARHTLGIPARYAMLQYSDFTKNHETGFESLQSLLQNTLKET